MAATVVVDDDGQATLANCGGVGAVQMTIQGGVNAASATETVKVCPGTYAELVTVNKNGLIMQGAQAGVDARARSVPVANESVVRGATTAGGRSTSFNVTANNVTIDGFTAQEATDANQFGGALLLGTGTSGHVVKNNIVQTSIVGALLGSDSTTFERNRFDNNDATGPAGGTAIYTDQFYAGGTLSDITIDSNRFLSHDQQTAVLNLSSTAPASPTTNVTITNNEFEANSRALVAFNLTSSRFANNVVSGSNFAGSADVRLFEGTANLVVEENVLAGTTFNLDASRINNIGTGAADATGITFRCNLISGYPGQGLRVDAGGYAGPLVAESNWWGSSTGPTIASNPGGTGEQITDPDGLVDYSPFLTDDFDSDAATGFQCKPRATITDATATEGNSGTTALSFTVALDEARTLPSTIGYATRNGSASSGTDYESASGTLNFAPGETLKTVTVNVTGDTADEPNETFFVDLLSPSNATLLDAEGAGTITDDDEPAPANQPPADADGDGVPDASDLCPAQAAATATGCPSSGQQPPADADADGVPDASDLCPAQAAATTTGCPASGQQPTGPTNGDDVLNGTPAANTICGLLGNDTIRGLAGNDTLFGDVCGDSSIARVAQAGGDGSDLLIGGAGNDTLNGAGGADTLRGEAGNDKLNGGGGPDALNGGAGKNNVKGGAGDDVVKARNRKRDRVDCGPGKFDRATVDRNDRVRRCERVKRRR